MSDHWRSKYSEGQVAFTQSPLLRNNPRILTNSYNLSSCCKWVWCSQYLLVRPVPVVSSHMRGNAAALGELAIANGTVVRLFPAAKIHLHLQGLRKDKTCESDNARLGLLLGWKTCCIEHTWAVANYIWSINLLSFILAIKNSLLHLWDDFLLIGPVRAFSTVGAKMGFEGGGACVT